MFRDHFTRIFFISRIINIQKSLYRLFHVYYFFTLPDGKSGVWGAVEYEVSGTYKVCFMGDW